MIIDRRVFLISGLMNELKSMMSRVPLSMMIGENDHQDMIKITNHQKSCDLSPTNFHDLSQRWNAAQKQGSSECDKK
jgi:hypothetical protein